MEISEHEKLLLFLGRPGRGKRSLVERVSMVVPTLLQRLGSRGGAATVMSALTFDPFRAMRGAPGYQVTVELHTGGDRDSLLASVGCLLTLLGGEVEPSDAAVAIGRDFVFKRGAPQPVRFQYLMRRRKELTHEAYSKHYAQVHSVFGMKTRGNEGYVQLHVDPTASREIADRFGLGYSDFDSVAQLDLRSLARFLAFAPYNATLGGLQDEAQFVDRAASSMFVSRIVGARHW